MHYGHSDFTKFTEAVNWLLNEDTEAADVMASGREFHSRIVRGANDFYRAAWNADAVLR